MAAGIWILVTGIILALLVTSSWQNGQGRMRDLDQGRTKREGALQRDVEQANRALIQQQTTLACSPRSKTAFCGVLVVRSRWRSMSK